MGAVKNCVKILYYKEFAIMEKNELIKLNEEAKKQYDELCKQGLKLDMSRGKPSPAQLDLSLDMLTHCLDGDYMSETGVDCRNYGVLDGIEEAKRLCMPMLGVAHDEIIIGGNSSLQLMYDTMARAMLLGVLGGDKPWGKNEKVKFLCPAPGYDRHFAICQSLGIEMITVPYTPDGPDMDVVEKLVSEDELIKGIWCVPMYSNPDGYTYSDETVKRFAALKPAAEDFRIFWDNAYCVHHLKDDHDSLLNIFDEAKKCGNEDMIFEFASTSKITFPGAGVAVIAASENNVKQISKLLGMQNISYDKVNQLRHVRYFGNADGLRKYMEKHKAILAPKFDTVIRILTEQMGDLDILTWNEPKGGYFISVNTLDGCAKEVARLCKEGGVVLTGAGATFPYKKDPNDKNIRLSPSFPTLEDLTKAMELFCICVKLASAEKLLAK